MLARFLATAAALAVVTYFIPGITLHEADLAHEIYTVVGVAVIFGLVNALVKPIFTFFSAPFILFTLGLFLLVINGALLLLTSWIAGQIGLGWKVENFTAAFWGALLLSIVSWILNAFFDNRRRAR